MCIRDSSTTEQWAGAAIAGPNSRALLMKLFPNTDVSNEGLPFMGYKEADLFGFPAKIYRISFSGELAYEVNVESDYGNFMREKIIEVGKARYGVMLREDGIVMDDGTTTRISENHYHMTTTTAQAANVLSHLEYYLQLVWPEVNVNVV